MNVHIFEYKKILAKTMCAFNKITSVFVYLLYNLKGFN